jgi:DNA mismatch repair protein MutL
MVTNMRKIQVLDEHVANQIAAGEVVERPASVIKELVENAVDAGSTRIEITAEEGGLHYIRVLDNGCGMPLDECSTAFQRHATSKIVSGEDLFQIRSLGFRGEALPSIAAVAKVDCVTAANKTGLARKLTIHGGQIIEVAECNGQQGTDMQVRELFYNTPARLKYMKTIQTELSHISDYVYRMALAYPHISFQLWHNGQQLLHTLGNGDLLQTIAAVYGTSAARQMVAFKAESVDYQISGYISKPEWNRSNRNGITSVVNGRFIKNYALTNALIDAYHTLLPLHRYPLAVLHLNMDPKLVDVNVHPAKLEVRFSKEQELTRLISDTIRAQLLQADLVPQVIRAQVNREEPSQPQLPLFEQTRQPQVQPQSKAPTPVYHQKTSPPITESRRQEVREQLQPPAERAPAPQLPMMFPIGQIHGTYIVAQNERGMYLIDQHAAHERLNYELFYDKMASPEALSQELLIPITLTLTPSDAQIVSNKCSLLEAVGVYLEAFGGNSFIVRAYPAWFPAGEEHTLIDEMIEYLLTEKQTVDIGKLREKAAIMTACKASIKANRSLAIHEMESLIERLRQCRVPFTCPHGRPIVISFSTYDLEKMFKRVM